MLPTPSGPVALPLSQGLPPASPSRVGYARIGCAMAAYPSGPVKRATLLTPSRWCGCNGSLNTPLTRSKPGRGGRVGEGKAQAFKRGWHYKAIVFRFLLFSFSVRSRSACIEASLLCISFLFKPISETLDIACFLFTSQKPVANLSDGVSYQDTSIQPFLDRSRVLLKDFWVLRHVVSPSPDGSMMRPCSRHFVPTLRLFFSSS